MPQGSWQAALFGYRGVKIENAYILGGLRSYVGVVNGMYRHIPAEVLGAEVLKQVMDCLLYTSDAADDA